MTNLDDLPDIELWEMTSGMTHLAFEGLTDTFCGIPLRGPARSWLSRASGLPEYVSCRRCSARYVKLMEDGEL